MNTKEFILSVLVKNQPDSLMRISNLFSRRAYPIKSISVGEAEANSLSRITIVSEGEEHDRLQIVRQLEKLWIVENVEIMTSADIFTRELMLVQMNIMHENKESLKSILDQNNARIARLSSTSMIIEISGETFKLNAFLTALKPFQITKVSRTGLTAI
jgi:acetolactate synthase-1/3 small subunit